MNKEILMINMLRKDSRKSFVKIAEELNIPSSQIHRVYMKILDSGKIKRYTTLFDSRTLDYFQHNILFLKPKNKNSIYKLYEFKEINNIFKLSDQTLEIHVLHENKSCFIDFKNRISEFFKIKKHLELVEPLKEEGFLF